MRRLDGALVHRDEHMRNDVHLELGTVGRGGTRGDVVLQDRKRLHHLDARVGVAVVQVGPEQRGHCVGVGRRRMCTNFGMHASLANDRESSMRRNDQIKFEHDIV